VMSFRGSGNAPRCVRNFFVELEADGIKKVIRTGPHGHKGGLYLKVLIREGGQVSDSYLEIKGESDGDTNTLIVKVHDGDGPVREMVLATLSNIKPARKGGTAIVLDEIKERPVTMKRDKAFWKMPEEDK